MYNMRQYLYSRQLCELIDGGMEPAKAVSLMDAKFEKDMELPRAELEVKVEKTEAKSISNAERIKNYIDKFVTPNADVIAQDDVDCM